jgi:type I restriction enzyme M protein
LHWIARNWARQLPKKDNQRMNTETHRQLANDIWSICNLLRGPYKRNEYRKVILPLTVLRRFDCLLAPTKPQALITFNA